MRIASTHTQCLPRTANAISSARIGGPMQTTLGRRGVWATSALAGRRIKYTHPSPSPSRVKVQCGDPERGESRLPPPTGFQNAFSNLEPSNVRENWENCWFSFSAGSHFDSHCYLGSLVSFHCTWTASRRLAVRRAVGLLHHFAHVSHRCAITNSLASGNCIIITEKKTDLDSIWICVSARKKMLQRQKPSSSKRFGSSPPTRTIPRRTAKWSG